MLVISYIGLFSWGLDGIFGYCCAMEMGLSIMIASISTLFFGQAMMMKAIRSLGYRFLDTALVRKPHLFLVLVVFLLSSLFQGLVMYWQPARADEPVERVNLVAVLVDNKIYKDIQADVERYTRDYIQQQLSNTKALVFPIDVKIFTPAKIAKILENLYFEGEVDKVSSLQGVILIGDIAIPQVNDQGTSYPSIYPYVDFVDPLFVYNESSKTFDRNIVPITIPQPEIWHGIMPFGNDSSSYHRFFAKLKKYVADPSTYVARKMWYDDIIQMKQTFLHEQVPYYSNNFLFTEDIGNNRLTNLMLDVMRESHNDIVENALDALQEAVVPSVNDGSDSDEAFDSALNEYQSRVNQVLKDKEEHLTSVGIGSALTPTLFLKDILQEMTKPYIELYSSDYRNSMTDRVKSTGRWSDKSVVDSHLSKMTSLDDLLVRNINQYLEPLLVTFNTMMEEKFNQEMQLKRYHMTIPLYVRTDNYDGNISLDEMRDFCRGTLGADKEDRRSTKNLRDIYENYYFGRPAGEVENPLDLTMYRGTFRNFTDINQLPNYDYSNLTQGLTDLSKKSIGGSFGMNDRQIIASRGYNIFNVESDLEAYSGHNDIYGKKACQNLTIEEFVRAYRGGHSPLNLTLTGDGSLWLKNATTDYARQPLWGPVLFDRVIGGPLYDIGGARLVMEEVPQAYDVRSASVFAKHQDITRKAGLFGGLGDSHYLSKKLLRKIIPIRYCALDERDFRTDPIDFFSWHQKGDAFIHVNYTGSLAPRVCVVDASGGDTHNAHFRFVDSRQYNTAPTFDQLSGLNITTPDRPIDSVKYVSFVGIGGDIVSLDYPNIYHIEVYSGENEHLILKSVDEIEQSLKGYLTGVVARYNQPLKDQLAKSTSYYNSHKAAFDTLAVSDQSASPHRQYEPLDEKFFVDYLGEGAIRAIAELLYRQNLPWKYKTAEKNVLDDLSSSLLSTDINSKIRAVMQEYLVTHESFNSISMPGYVPDGYEVAYLNSDRQDFLYDEDNIPPLIKDIRKDFVVRPKVPVTDDLRGSQAEDIAKLCGYPLTEGLLIYDIEKGKSPRWDAVKCWYEKISTKPFDISVTFPGTGPLFVDKVLKSITSTGQSNFGSFVGDTIDPFLSQWGQYDDQRKGWGDQLQGRLDREEKTQQSLTDKTLSSSVIDQLLLIHQGLDIKASPYRVLLDPEKVFDEALHLEISSSRDVGTINISLSSTGGNCLSLIGKSDDLCRNSAQLVLDPFKKPEIFSLLPLDGRVGESDIVAKVCVASDCIFKTTTISFVAGPVDHISMNFPFARVAVEGRLPFSLSAFDGFNNNIGLQQEQFVIEAERGSLGQVGNARITFIDFKDAAFTYIAPPTAGPDTLRVYRVDVSGQKKVFVEDLIDVSIADVLVTHRGSDVNQLQYRLPNRVEDLTFLDHNNIVQVNTGVLLPLKLSLSDGSAVGGIVNISSKTTPLMDVGILTNIPLPQKDGTMLYQTQFSPRSSFLMAGDSVQVRLYPRGKAGKESLLFSILGQTGVNKELKVEVLPAEAYRVNLRDTNNVVDAQGSDSSSPSKALMEINESKELRLQVTDVWGNRVDRSVALQVGSFGPVSIMGDDTAYISSEKEKDSFINVDSAEHGGRAYVYTRLNDISLDQQEAGFFEIIVQESFLPMKNLNVMYLNLWGSDRGSLSGEKSIVKNLFDDSPTLLALTTQLTDPTITPSWSYNSVEASRFGKADVGFLGDMNNISLFGNGQRVGEATRFFGSPALINIGDPLLKRLNENIVIKNTDVDAGKGQQLFADNGKGVMQSIPIDFNNDKIQDLLVVHSDSTIRLLKGYGGDIPYEDLGAWMLVTKGIKEVFVGDVDGNKYQDVIILSSDKQLRVYKNTGGVIDVDGLPVCLGIHQGPQSIKSAYQFFVEDMDKDGVVDIITNSRDGRIQVFWGGKGQSGDNFLSKDQSHCDSEWEKRQTSTLVTHFGVEISLDDMVHDASLIHWKGLWYDPFQDIPLDNLDGEDSPLAEQFGGLTSYGNAGNGKLKKLKDIRAAVNVEKILKQTSQFPIDQLVEESVVDRSRYIASPYPEVPSYYDKQTRLDQIYYIPLYALSQEDPLDVFKQYHDLDGGILVPGDDVRVTVTLKANKAGIYSFIDKIDGPWKIVLDSNLAIRSFDPGSIPGGAAYVPFRRDGYQYVLDNIVMSAGQTVSFTYEMEFEGGEMVTMAIRDENDDSYPDIIVQPVKSCLKARWSYMNHQKRGFDESFDDLSKVTVDYTSDADETTQEAFDDLNKSIESAMSAMDLSQLPGMDFGFAGGNADGLTLKKALKEWLIGGTRQGDTIDLDIGGKLGENIDRFQQDAMEGLCNGFDVSGLLKSKKRCSGLPVPFNMAFLAPGTYNVMGCKLMEDKGLPVFHFPGTVYTPIGAIPFPWGQKFNSTDKFYWAGGGVYPSWIRIYLAPTLTMQLGMAICLGPMNAALKLPKPFANVVGNCIVTKLPLPVAGCKENKGNRNAGEQFDNDWYDLGQQSACNDPATIVSKGNFDVVTSPFSFVSVEFGGKSSPALPPMSFGGGFINFDAVPVSIFDDDEVMGSDPVTLQGGSPLKLKIQGGNMKGLAQCIVQDWMDNQVNYMLNNLTTMSINLYLPEFNNLFQGFGTLGDFKKLYDQENKVDLIDMQSSISGGNFDYGGQGSEGMTKFYSAVKNSKYPEYASVQNFMQRTTLNPFDALAGIFNEVPLIDITTHNINLKVPLLASEDIIRYASLSDAWLERNGRILDDWKNIFQSFLGTCSSLGNDGGDNPDLGDLFSDPAVYHQKGQDIHAGLVSKRQAIENEMKYFESVPSGSPGYKTAQEQLASRRQQMETIENCLDGTQDAQMEQFLVFNDNIDKLMTSVRQNLHALEAYQRFPAELSAWLQSIDRYMVELAQFIDGTMGQMTHRLDINSKLFEQHVDAIILAIAAFETWQAVIDLTVNWKQHCASCSNDNYDYFSCSLSFLCPKLPILPIPPFKIPNINIDLSHLDLGVDFVLPRINIQPIPMPLPSLPDLPYPPTVEIDLLNIDLYIPSIPVIPSPPDLPPLPSFIPRIKMSLPTLPPAPKIPVLSSKFDKILNISKTIGNLFCIMKSDIGLVGEKSVKSKIEQITQRTWQVPFFDYFDLTSKFSPPPLVGFDYQIDGFLDFNVEFDTAFSAVDSLADKRNNAIEDVTSLAGAGMSKVQKGLNEAEDATRLPGSIDVPTLDPSKLGGYVGGLENNKAFDAIKASLQEISSMSDDGVTQASVDRIQKLLALRESPLDTHEGLQEVFVQARGVIDEQREHIKTLLAQSDAQQLTSFGNPPTYSHLLSASPSVDNTVGDKDILLSTSLFSYNQDFELLREHESPTSTYMKTQQQIVDGYRRALATSQASDLGLSHDSYQSLLSQADQTQMKLMALSQGNVARSSENNTSGLRLENKLSDQSTLASLATQKQIAQAGPGAQRAAAFLDLGKYVNGVLIRDKERNWTNVIASQPIIQRIGDRFKRIDINDDSSDDVLWRDEKGVFVKYGKQNNRHATPLLTHYMDYFVFDLSGPLPGDKKGYVSSLDTRIKVWDSSRTVKNLAIQGQEFDQITLSRSNHHAFGYQAQGYLVKLATKADVLKEGKKADVSYVLVLPDGASSSGTQIELDMYEKAVLIDRVGTGILLDVLFYDEMSETVSITLTELPRMWHYIRVAPLALTPAKKTQGFFSSLRSRPAHYDMIASWSNQIIGGQQIIADEEGPDPLVSLYRPSIASFVSSGEYLQGYVGTTYDLHASWEDDVGVSGNRLRRGDKLIQATGNKIAFNGLHFTGKVLEKFAIGATDFNGNSTQRAVSLRINVPKINIKTIDYVDEDLINVGVSLDQDIDQGQVSFANQRLGNWGHIESLAGVGYRPVGPRQMQLTGGLFDISDDIGLYLADKKQIGEIDPHHGRIELFDASYILRVHFITGTPIVDVIASAGGKVMFSILLPTKKLGSVKIFKGDYTSIPLDSSYLGSFKGGVCVANASSQCVAYVSPTGSIYVPPDWRARISADYSFDKANKMVILDLKDENKHLLARVSFTAQSMLP